MTPKTVSEEEIQAVVHELKSYAFYRKMLRLARYEEEFFGGRERPEPDHDDRRSYARLRMVEIRHFVMSMENSDEKLFLYYHYIREDSVERCAELLGISRSSAFRMKKRAHLLAALHKEDA